MAIIATMADFVTVLNIIIHLFRSHDMEQGTVEILDRGVVEKTWRPRGKQPPPGNQRLPSLCKFHQ